MSYLKKIESHIVTATTYPVRKSYPEGKGPRTPWGPAQYAYFIVRGVTLFGTAGHGGIGIGSAAAKKFLSPNARSLADRHGGNYWYEEDCLFAVPLYEHPEWIEALKKIQGIGASATKEEMEKIIKRWEPKYFDAVTKKEAPHYKEVMDGDEVWFSGKAYKFHKGGSNPAGFVTDSIGNSYRFPTKTFEQRVEKIIRDGKTIFEK